MPSGPPCILYERATLGFVRPCPSACTAPAPSTSGAGEPRPRCGPLPRRPPRSGATSSARCPRRRAARRRPGGTRRTHRSNCNHNGDTDGRWAVPPSHLPRPLLQYHRRPRSSLPWFAPPLPLPPLPAWPCPGATSSVPSAPRRRQHTFFLQRPPPPTRPRCRPFLSPDLFLPRVSRRPLLGRWQCPVRVLPWPRRRSPLHASGHSEPPPIAPLHPR